MDQVGADQVGRVHLDLEAADVPASLRDLAAGAVGRGVRLETSIDEDAAERLGPAGEEAVFRVAQEALRNALKHSRCSVIRLSFTAPDSGDPVRLEVADDGVGLAGPVPQSRPDSFGLRLMADQAEAAGAWLGVRSTPGAGTTIRMEVPAS